MNNDEKMIENTEKSMTQRTINVPDQIVLSDGTTTKTIDFKTCEAFEYLRLCISLRFYNEEGVI